ncbi:hypothetical protein [Chromobacterium sp. ATCC 53434]|uniref:hypothetical protein n=1 Tax=Chromobacterium sp. (strain ATCC 53434 / SC 14030) TaxID=2059672 RepID=UPI0013051767|nr:hypothetical protein [Chromobacterium sp. ATCC 53434]
MTKKLLILTAAAAIATGCACLSLAAHSSPHLFEAILYRFTLFSIPASLLAIFGLTRK